MLYTAVFFCALFSQWGFVFSALPAVSTVTYTSTAGGLRSLANKNNLLVVGDPAAVVASAEAGGFFVAYYTYGITGTSISDGDFTEALSAIIPALAAVPTSIKANQLGRNDKDKNGNAFLGLGYDVAIADEQTFFISQSSKTANTGRVFVYEGNVTDFKGVQLLIPYDGKHKLDSDSFFGESIAAKSNALAVGCQNCNTTAPVNSGAVYVYKPTKSGWSESQVLTVDDVAFFGERVAIHDKILVAAGEDADRSKAKGCFNSGSSAAWRNCINNVADTLVVFEEGPGGKFDKRQTLQAKSGSTYEGISSVAVFDETIALATIGSDTAIATPVVPAVAGTDPVADKVYIYYPKTKRYGLDAKPGPLQWTQIQVLTAANTFRWTGGNPSLSLSHNNLKYLTVSDVAPTTDYTDADIIALAESSRLTLGGRFSAVTVTAGTPLLSATSTGYGLTSDGNSFFTIGLTTAAATTTVFDKAIPVGIKSKCITISLQDQFKDGWGIASLLVESPDGSQDRYFQQCTTENPEVYLFCPTKTENGVYRFHIENGEETPFGWEIHWRVAVNGVWYRGDKRTRLDFHWNDKYDQFEVGALKNTLPLVDTCEVCRATKPEGKHRSLSNLRSLNHKGKTSAPTGSRAPTIAVAAGATTYWNEFQMFGSTSVIWFDSGYEGAYFWVSDAAGSKLFKTGTSCTAVTTTPVKCWVDLPDGDYKLRVGRSTKNSALAAADDYYEWKFCNIKNNQKADNELSFTIKDGECFAGFIQTAENKCKNKYKATYWLKVDLMLSGGVTTLSVADSNTLKTGVTETLQSVLVSYASKAVMQGQSVTSTGLEVSVLVEFESINDLSALNNLVGSSSLLDSASNLLKSDLVGSHALSTNFMKGQLSSVSIVSVQTVEYEDFSNVDESSFKTVSDYVWTVPAAEQSYVEAHAENIAISSFAFVAVAAVLAVSLFVKRAMTKTTAVVEEVSAKVAPTFKPKFTAADMESSEESASDQDSESEVAASNRAKQSKRVKLASLPQRQINVAGIKQLINDEDEAFKNRK